MKRSELKEVARVFAEHLIGGRYVAARKQLSAAAQREFSAASLEDEFVEMLACYDGPAEVCSYISVLNGDKGNTVVYASIDGQGFGEAVIVDIDGDGRICAIEWGRP